MKKNERIKHKKIFDKLFREGKSFHVRSIKFIYYFQEETNKGPTYPKVAFSAPRRLYPQAVTRNRIKRLLREAWRLNKISFNENQLFMLLVYQSKNILAFQEIVEIIKEGVNTLKKHFAQNACSP
ncbi:MAG: ribonuclease P protein component [Bacteroidia bacterium]|nr:ribonuclease P protein component [Bacteroidia bacterium]MDW8158523.1 ribonuclease P protein component [Bacteroidia bacterium]